MNLEISEKTFVSENYEGGQVEQSSMALTLPGTASESLANKQDGSLPEGDLLTIRADHRHLAGVFARGQIA